MLKFKLLIVCVCFSWLLANNVFSSTEAIGNSLRIPIISSDVKKGVLTEQEKDFLDDYPEFKRFLLDERLASLNRTVRVSEDKNKITIRYEHPEKADEWIEFYIDYSDRGDIDVWNVEWNDSSGALHWYRDVNRAEDIPGLIDKAFNAIIDMPSLTEWRRISARNVSGQVLFDRDADKGI